MLNKPKECDGCPLREISEGYAPGEGPTNASVVLVGEALGFNEAQQGRPFVGGTGNMLRAMLRQADLPPETIYITNVVKCRPPGNRTPLPGEVDACVSRYLSRELRVIQPSITIACGNIPLNVLVPGASGITRSRGYTFRGRYGKVLPIVHPSYTARGNPEFWAITVVDLIKARKEAETHEYRSQRERFIINPNIHDVRRVCTYILNQGIPFSFDIETVGDREKLNILCIGIGWSDEEALCIPLLRSGGYEYWNTSDEDEVVEWIWKLLTSPNIKVGQNVFTFDIPRLQEHGFRISPPVEDTLINHHTIATELPHSLLFLASIYTNMVDYKGTKVTLWADDQELRTYNCRDCIATYISWTGINSEMKELGLR